MFSPLLKYTAIAAVIAGVIAQTTLTINTPQVSFSFPQPQLAHIPAVATLLLASPPFCHGLVVQSHTNFITSGDDASGATLVDLGTQTDNSETYTPTQQANTRIVFNIRDSTGLIAQTGIITVGAGSTTTCSSASSGSTATGSSGGATASGSTAATTGTGSSTKTTGTSTGTGTSAGSSSTASDNAASAQLSGAGFAGVLGAALVALLA